MTKPEAWKTIGDAFNTPFEDRTERQVDLTALGICAALYMLNEFDMAHSIVVEDPSNFYPYFYPTRDGDPFCTSDAINIEADAFRAKYCYERMNDELG